MIDFLCTVPHLMTSVVEKMSFAEISRLRRINSYFDEFLKEKRDYFILRRLDIEENSCDAGKIFINDYGNELSGIEDLRRFTRILVKSVQFPSFPIETKKRILSKEVLEKKIICDHLYLTKANEKRILEKASEFLPRFLEVEANEELSQPFLEHPSLRNVSEIILYGCGPTKLDLSRRRDSLRYLSIYGANEGKWYEEQILCFLQSWMEDEQEICRCHISFPMDHILMKEKIRLEIAKGAMLRNGAFRLKSGRNVAFVSFSASGFFFRSVPSEEEKRLESLFLKGTKNHWSMEDWESVSSDDDLDSSISSGNDSEESFLSSGFSEMSFSEEKQ